MENDNFKNKELMEPTTDNKIKKPQQGKGKDFKFDRAFAKELTVYEAKAEMRDMIKLWKREK